jgi:uncharacterized protein (TIGR03382 family)
VTLLAGILLATAPARAEDWPPGATIQEAVLADITPEGFESVALLIPSLLPSQVDIPTTGGGSDNGFCLIDYEYEISGAWVGIQVIDAQITPGNGVLDVTASLLVNVNNPSDKFNVSFEAACVGDDCPGYVDAFPVTIHTTMALAVVPGPDGVNVLDATMGAVDVTYDLTNDDIHLDCFIGDLEDVLNYVGLSIYDLILGQVDSLLQDQVSSLGPTLETTIEDAFSSASISQDLDLNGATAHITLQPSAIDIQPSGVRMMMSGAVSGDAAACITAFDPSGSLRTDSSTPAIAFAPAGVRTPYHLGIGLSDDFANQTFYTLWRGGLLCYSLAPGGAFPLDTSILNLLSGDTFAELFPESQPVTLRTLPRAAPTVNYTGPDDVDVNINDLDLEFYADLDGRAARVVSVSLNGIAGADLTLDPATGMLGVAVDVDPANLTPTVVYNEMYPEANASIEASFSSSFGSLLDTILGSFLGDALGFALPSFSGLGLQSIETAATGPSEDWLGAYAMIGSVTYGDGSSCGGCGGDTGGGSSGCSSGCASAPGVPVWMGLLPLGLAVMLRRRA